LLISFLLAHHQDQRVYNLEPQTHSETPCSFQRPEGVAALVLLVLNACNAFPCDSGRLKKVCGLHSDTDPYWLQLSEALRVHCWICLHMKRTTAALSVEQSTWNESDICVFNQRYHVDYTYIQTLAVDCE
jgi:hypothetical protein